LYGIIKDCQIFFFTGGNSVPCLCSGRVYPADVYCSGRPPRLPLELYTGNHPPQADCPYKKSSKPTATVFGVDNEVYFVESHINDRKGRCLPDHCSMLWRMLREHGWILCKIDRIKEAICIKSSPIVILMKCGFYITNPFRILSCGGQPVRDT
jgi:hypothetical protein